ncbi:acyl-CoA dehydrogenase family protein [Oceanicoccus sp. KOV_DT_Chl]|uniref:acyl-CoA dehydrogenase family protein n=1 Tax=Oceanicoccus sp. KOV_DT_Chl TaxID=1904639 RepID=UPI000C7DA404|nr:acyl-CoA dehydrogenase [Oceanicoccus sp. KOV_DT_Chl]
MGEGSTLFQSVFLLKKELVAQTITITGLINGSPRVERSAMFSFDEMPMPSLGLGGLEADLTEEERAIQDVAHRFAKDVMRPIGQQLDAMTAAQVIAPDSPLWSYFQQLKDSGILDLETMMAMDYEQKARIIPLIFEELGWGDSGLAVCALATSFPAFAAMASGDEQLIAQFGSRLGCWIATQPDRGSDLVDVECEEIYPGSRQSKPNLQAKIQGDEVIVNGQSSAWVTGAPLAETALAYIPCDYGEGIYNAEGGLHQIAILIDLNDPDVSKGKPLDKLGQRPLPQGEVFFDEVKVPIKNVLAQGDKAVGSFHGAITFGNMEMGFTFTGVARAAFEHALAYVHERKQGGTEIINHQSVRLRLFDLWRKVEAARAMAHRVASYNYSSHGPHLLASVTSKTFVTRAAYEVASEALLLFGGNGLTKEYPIEKIVRDAQAALIEDGENNILSLKGADWLSKWYKANKL